jgi:hydroxyacylglutathione hydrolase
MFLEKVKSNVVSHLSYFLGSGTDAVVIDPRRDCHIYVDISKREGMEIQYIFETHRNEDYVIGSKELSKLSGASIYHGPWPDFQYGKVVYDEQVFNLGNLSIKALYTPGHTPGCTSFAVWDKKTGNYPVFVFTGDTLFVNDVGRIDFGGDENKHLWAENMYNSIHKKLLPLGDNVIIFPAHGAGSLCASNIAKREISTLGAERLMNPLLQLKSKEFIDFKVNEHHELPPYFKVMETLNKEGAPSLGCNLNLRPLSPSEFKDMIEKGAIVVDTRPPPGFGVGHIKDSYNVPLSRLGLLGWVLPYDDPLLFVLDKQDSLDKVTHSLARLGYDNQFGYLSGTIVKWYLEAYELMALDLMSVYDLKDRLDSDDNWHVLDVRRLEEYDSGHIAGSQNLYVGRVEAEYMSVPSNIHVAVICASGTRSSFASSMLLRKGTTNIHNVLGGMTAWKKAGFPVEIE